MDTVGYKWVGGHRGFEQELPGTGSVMGQPRRTVKAAQAGG